ncbi:MAG: glycosyltransferase family 2 protein [Methylocystaceae bacterium]
MMKVTVVLPAYNEEKLITSTLRSVKAAGFAHRILVIDDGSADRTAELAASESVEVITLHPNRGKGGALNYAATLVDTPVVIFLDADLGDTAGEAALLLEPIMTGRADLTIARFPPAIKKGGFGLVKNLARSAIKRAGGPYMESPLSGQRAMKIEVMQALMPFASGYGIEMGMTLRALRKGYQVEEVPTRMRNNETGRDLAGFWHRGKQFMQVARVALKEGSR